MAEIASHGPLQIPHPICSLTIRAIVGSVLGGIWESVGIALGYGYKCRIGTKFGWPGWWTSVE